MDDDELLEMPEALAPPAGAERSFASLEALYRAEAQKANLRRPGFSDRFVPGEGRVGAPLMLVGEQPGDQEDLAGRPFVGPAGRILDLSLQEAGIDRRETFVTNALKRFKFSPRGKRRMHQTPTAGDVAHSRWWLAEEIRLVHPAVVVALGGTALLALTGQRTLKPVRGRILQWGGRLLLATVHPSYLLRIREEPQRSEEQARFVEELEKAAAAAS